MNNGLRNILSLLLVFSIVSFVLAGCSSTSTSSDVKIKTQEAPNTIVLNDDEMMMKDTKDSTEKMHDTMMELIPDGTYTDDVTYSYHSGDEMITISLTVKDDIITDASITPHDPHPVSAKFISGVNAALPDLVIGKSVKDVSIPEQVSGSSLTTAAFKGYFESLQNQ